MKKPAKSGLFHSEPYSTFEWYPFDSPDSIQELLWFDMLTMSGVFFMN
jgi:hypothetical protein